MSEPKRDPKTNTWYFVADLPSPDGKRRQAKRRGFPTKKVASREQRQLLQRAEHGTLVDPSRLMTGDYLTGQWDSALEGRNLRRSTLDSYRQIVRTHLVPHLGAIRLQALDTAAVEGMLSALAVAGRKPKTIRNVAGVLSKALGDALRWKLVARNAASGALLPKVERRPLRAWTPEQVARFLAHVDRDRLAPLWRFIAVTGARRGEALGLRWSDLDLDAGTATIRTSRVVTTRGVVEGPTKTTAGARTIALDPDTVSALTTWRRDQRA